MGTLTKLRTQLRTINMEYSALVRQMSDDRRFARMSELRRERAALMALIAQERGRESPRASRYPSARVAPPWLPPPGERTGSPEPRAL
jgi:hypothetical protein